MRRLDPRCSHLRRSWHIHPLAFRKNSSFPGIGECGNKKGRTEPGRKDGRKSDLFCKARYSIPTHDDTAFDRLTPHPTCKEIRSIQSKGLREWYAFSQPKAKRRRSAQNSIYSHMSRLRVIERTWGNVRHGKEKRA